MITNKAYNNLHLWILKLIHPKSFIYRNRLRYWIKIIKQKQGFSTYDCTDNQLKINPIKYHNSVGISYQKNNFRKDALLFFIPGNKYSPYHYHELIKKIAHDNQMPVYSFFNPGVAGSPGKIINQNHMIEHHTHIIKTIIQHHEKLYNITPKVFIHGFSLGGVIALLSAETLIKTYPNKIFVITQASFSSASDVAKEWAPIKIINGILTFVLSLLALLNFSFKIILPTSVLFYGIVTLIPQGTQSIKFFYQLIIKAVLHQFNLTLNCKDSATYFSKNNNLLILHPVNDQTVPYRASLYKELHHYENAHFLNPSKHFRGDTHSLTLDQLQSAKINKSGLEIMKTFILNSLNR